MYPNLLAEMARAKVTSKELAEKLGITESTFSMKLNGKAKFTLNEARLVKVALNLGDEVPLDVLFDGEV